MSRLLALLLVALAPLSVFAQDEEDQLFQKFGEPVGDFKLQERGGKFVRVPDLQGKIWVAQFFYPGCNLCSRNTPTMKKLQDHYRGKSVVRLVSIDLRNSGRETLNEYAHSHEAEPDQWL